MTSRTLGDFLGDWRITREIRIADGSVGHFVGMAHWTADREGALYHESGELEMPGQGRFRAERQYRWGADLSVWFSDGRFFHHIPPLGGSASHWCDPDQYDAEYGFADWPVWWCQWRVRGPRKDYVMTSHYRRDAW